MKSERSEVFKQYERELTASMTHVHRMCGLSSIRIRSF